LKLADYVVTEAGFGADLGAEKFFDIKCRMTGLKPQAVVIVATVRALKMHGGVAKENLGAENVAAVVRGFSNLKRHVENVQKFGVPPVVAINRFSADTDAELAKVRELCASLGVDAIDCTHWADGGKGAVALAEAVLRVIDERPAQFKPLYTDDMPLWDKIKTIATEMYGADDIIADKRIRDQLRELDETDVRSFPICMAKTQFSFSTDPSLKGAPSGHVVPIRELRVSAGAGFLVAICGEIMTMPGLPKTPAAERIDVDDDGRITGLF
jgi:formate--tetrahydrofolate ligase